MACIGGHRRILSRKNESKDLSREINLDTTLWSWRASQNDITVLDTKLANQRSRSIVCPIKTFLSTSKAWSPRFFPPWLRPIYLWWESTTKTWNKFVVKSRKNQGRSSTSFVLVSSLLAQKYLKQRQTIAKFSLLAAHQLTPYSLMEISEIFWNIRHQAVGNNVSYSYQAKCLRNQSLNPR